MNLTKSKRVANLAKWKAQGPAVIKHPLRFIERRAMRWEAELARLSVSVGDGQVVTSIARRALRRAA